MGLMSSCGFSLKNVERLGKCTPQEAKVGLGRFGDTGLPYSYH